MNNVYYNSDGIINNPLVLYDYNNPLPTISIVASQLTFEYTPITISFSATTTGVVKRYDWRTSGSALIESTTTPYLTLNITTQNKLVFCQAIGWRDEIVASNNIFIYYSNDMSPAITSSVTGYCGTPPTISLTATTTGTVQRYDWYDDGVVIQSGATLDRISTTAPFNGYCKAIGSHSTENSNTLNIEEYWTLYIVRTNTPPEIGVGYTFTLYYPNGTEAIADWKSSEGRSGSSRTSITTTFAVTDVYAYFDGGPWCNPQEVDPVWGLNYYAYYP